MPEYELKVDLEGVGIKEERVSDGELSDWLRRTATEVESDGGGDFERFRVVRIVEGKGA